MRLYIIRHGESETNLANCWTGWLDVPLTDKGIKDAARAGEILSGVSFDKVYASDLVRARKTAETALPGCDYEVTPLLREINVGSIAGKPLPVAFTPEMKVLIADGYAPIGGESYAELAERVQSFMKSIEESGYENVAAFSHAGVLRMALNTVVGATISKKVICSNCTVAVFEFSSGVWRLRNWINP